MPCSSAWTSRSPASRAFRPTSPMNFGLRSTFSAVRRRQPWGSRAPAQSIATFLVSSLEEYSQLSRIVDSLLFIAQAETSGTHICRETIDVAAELRGISEFYEPIAAEKLVTVTVRLDGELRTEVDRVLFRRAVGNLVSNAVAHTPSDGTVALTAVQDDSVTRVEVADTGIGITAEHLPHVFDRFYRVERARVRDPGCVGLGLSIVKVIMDLHEGSAEVASEPGAG